MLLTQQRLAKRYIELASFKKASLMTPVEVKLRDVFVHPLLSSQPRNLTLETRTTYDQGLTTFHGLSEMYKADVLLHQPSERGEKQRQGIDIDEVFLSQREGDGPRTTLVLGPPGSGKTTCFARILPHDWGQKILHDKSPSWRKTIRPVELDVLRDVVLLLVVKIRTNLDGHLVQAKAFDELFQLNTLGLDKEDIERVEVFVRKNKDPDRVWIVVDGK